MSPIRHDICDSVAGAGYNADCLISREDIEKVVRCLKRGKGDGSTGLTTDHFLFACSGLYVHISLLFAGLLTHCSAPDKFGLNTVIPIPNGRKGVLSGVWKGYGFDFIKSLCRFLKLL